ncbi:MAG: flagellar basal body P-ring protein FlgI [Chromatiales bacterium]|nr:flagellar basal body P-ring protein FlgI [Chromatiales bacterium]
MNIKTLLLILLFSANLAAAENERVKDIADVAGVRSNQLVGYGLVVGLDGSGDKNPFTEQSTRNMLTQLGITVPAGTKLDAANVAAVMLTTDLPPFAKPGQKIDVTVSSVGKAKSLRGGTLLMTPLKGADGKVYAIAQGNLVVGGLTAGGADGSRITVNIPSAGRIPGGATVERAVPSPFTDSDSLVLNLHTPDFTTANRLAESINRTLGPGTAAALDGSSVKVRAPRDSNQKVAFMSVLENLTVEPGEAPARIIINSRTGTVVINRHVTVTPAAVSHGNLTVTISENPEISQPNALAGGQTAIVPRTDVEVAEDANRMFLFDPGVGLDQIVRAVNQVGAAPSDLVAILEALKQAGALRAELIVI